MVEAPVPNCGVVVADRIPPPYFRFVLPRITRDCRHIGTRRSEAFVEAVAAECLADDGPVTIPALLPGRGSGPRKSRGRRRSRDHRPQSRLLSRPAARRCIPAGMACLRD